MHKVELLLFRPLSQGKRNRYLIKICIGDPNTSPITITDVLLKMQIRKRNKHKYPTNERMLRSRNMHGIPLRSDTDFNSVV